MWPVCFSRLPDTLLPTLLIGGKNQRYPCASAEQREKAIAPIIPQHLLRLLNGRKPELKYDGVENPFWEFGNVRCIRVGDYLTINMMRRAFNLCHYQGKCPNLGVVLLMGAHLRYRRRNLEAKATAKKKSKEAPDQRLLECIDRVGRDLDRVMTALWTSHPKKWIRMQWVQWNAFYVDADKFYNSEMQRWRKQLRDQFIRDNGVSEADRMLRFDEMMPFVYILIMLYSQNTEDERVHKTINALMNGRPDHLSFLAPLRHHPIQKLFDHFSLLFKTEGASGMHNLKAHNLLSFLVGLEVVHNGSIPGTHLDAFPEISDKKMRVALNGNGLYTGSGFDKHCIKFVTAFIKEGTDDEKEKRH